MFWRAILCKLAGLAQEVRALLVHMCSLSPGSNPTTDLVQPRLTGSTCLNKVLNNNKIK